MVFQSIPSEGDCHMIWLPRYWAWSLRDPTANIMGFPPVMPMLPRKNDVKSAICHVDGGLEGAGGAWTRYRDLKHGFVQLELGVVAERDPEFIVTIVM